MNIIKYIIIFLIIILILIYFFVPYNFKLFNRVVWTKNKRIINFKLNDKNTDKEIFDIYSFSHITHGVLLCYLLSLFSFNKNKIVIISIIIELIWEFFENTDYIINKYRKKDEYNNYDGDSIVNIIGDLISMIIGIIIYFKSKNFALIFIILLEIIFYPFNANFIKLSIGSLL
tara:strand:- start:5211 stop:5729 length:519 start_codon:yes stop_codon:yes gene_type:complete